MPKRSIISAVCFPYERLLKENLLRSRREPEFELEDTGIFDQDRYFDILVVYAKAAPTMC